MAFPLSRKTWSGPLVGGAKQVVFRVQIGQKPQPPPGFRQAAPWLDCTVRSVQPHCWELKVRLAWTSIQYVPEARTAAGVRFTVNAVRFTVTAVFKML
jgi:hypothetical protein